MMHEARGVTIGDKPTIHVVFTMSAAASIRQAFEQIGRRERVIGLPDNLGFGPIDAPNGVSRQEWVGHWLGYDWDEVVQMTALFWAEATSRETFPVAWMSRGDAGEYAGFLEFIWRMAGAPFRVVDATGVEVAQSHGRPGSLVASCLSLLNPTQIVEARLHDQQRALPSEEIAGYREKWRKLRAENAPIRVVDENGLVSAPITHFDAVILSCVSDDWQKGARVAGTTMGKLMDTPFDRCPSDLILWARVCALGDDGILEIAGGQSEMRGALVRIRSAQSHPE
jgi:uncharacterized protein DUF3658/uncharacterized protein DUF1835